MRIAGREKLEEFAKKHSASRPSLNYWIIITEQADWKKPSEVRATFASVDLVAGKSVFNIGGNKYRLIAKIQFEIALVIVLAVLTHKEYDKGKWK